MKRSVAFFLFIVILLGLPCKLFAQLEDKILYIYNRGDKLHMVWQCTNERPHLSDVGAELCDAGGMKYVDVSDKNTRGYWGKTEYEGVFVFEFITFGDNRGVWQNYKRQTWFFYESLNVITPISPDEINEKKDEIINDPWKYGHKAVYD